MGKFKIQKIDTLSAHVSAMLNHTATKEKFYNFHHDLNKSVYFFSVRERAESQPRKPGSLYLRGLRLRPWLRLVTWNFMNLLPKGEREKYQITCFHIKTLHFICKEWDIMYYFV